MSLCTAPRRDGESDSVDPSVEVTHWLSEVGRRKWTPARERVDLPSFPAPTPRNSRPLIRAVLLGLLAVTYLQYFYLDVLLDIASLPYLIFFGLLPGGT